MKATSSKCPIKFSYSNLHIGNLTSGFQLLCEIEGELSIYINNKKVFSEEYILLLELAVSLTKWINNYSNNFLYYSMDYEEGPILFFKENNLNHWQIGSVWMELIYSNINLLDLIYACRNFIENLTTELNENGLYTKNLFPKIDN